MESTKPVSVFLSEGTTWDSEELKIPENIKRGLIEELKWDRPSKIQKRAIPTMTIPDSETGQFENLIAQAKNGAGKTGAFVIGSLLRIDPAIQQAQVIVIGHTRELVKQISDVFERATRYAPEYAVCNLTLLDSKKKFNPKAQILVSTFGQLFASMSGRSALDLSQLRVFVLDEADSFFLDNRHLEEFKSFVDTINKLQNKVQFIFFSATYE